MTGVPVTPILKLALAADLLAFAGNAPFVFAAPPSAVTWDGGGDGTSWNDPLNWGDDRLPNTTNDVVIADPNTTVKLSGSTVSIISLQCAGGLTIAEGGLTLTGGSSLIAGAYTMAPGCVLNVSGAATVLAVSGPANIDGANLVASMGGRLSLPGASSYAHVDGSSCELLASGAGSVLDLAGLTNVFGKVPHGGETFRLSIRALAGGHVNLAGVEQMPTQTVSVTADGPSSLVDLSHLVSVSGVGDFYGGTSTWEARNGGTLLVPALKSAGVLWRLNPQGTIQLNALEEFTGGSVTIEGITVVFSAATNIVNASFYVRDGGVLSLPAARSYAHVDGSSCELAASGMGSVLDLAALTNISGKVPYGGETFRLSIQALAGGQVKLSGLEQIPTQTVSVTADGTNSVVDLSRLVSVSGVGDFYGGTSTWEERNEGRVLLPELKSAGGIVWRLNTIVPLTLGELTGGTLTVAGTRVVLAYVTNISDTSLYVRDGGMLSFPVARTYAHSQGAAPELAASGNGSVLDLTTVRNLPSPLLGIGTRPLSISASGGGQVRMGGLVHIPSQVVVVTSDGTNSLVDFSGLESAAGYTSWAASSAWEARNGGTIFLPELRNAEWIDWRVSLGGTLLPTNLTAMSCCSIHLRDGARWALPLLREYAHQAETACEWLAYGSDTSLDLPALTNMPSPYLAAGTQPLTISASAGGQLRMGGLVHIPSQVMIVTSDGTNSLVDFSGLESAAGYTSWAASSAWEARNGGTIFLPELRNAEWIDWRVSLGGTLLPTNLTVMSSCSIHLRDGARWVLPLLREYAHQAEIACEWLAYGSDTSLVLPALTNMPSPYLAAGTQPFTISAQAGGHLEFESIVQIASWLIVANAQGTNSAVSFPRLESLIGFTSWVGGSSVQMTNGGVVLLPRLRYANNVTFCMASACVFSNLVDFGSGSVYVRNGASVSFPALQHYTATTDGETVNTLRADGIGSVLSLPSLFDIYGNPNHGGFLNIEGIDGARVEMPAVTTMVAPSWGGSGAPRGIRVLADGTNSVVDLSGLVVFQNESTAGGSSFVARNGGAILCSRLAKISGVEPGADFLADGNASIVDLSSITLFALGSLEARNGGAILTPRLRFLDHASLTVRDTGRLSLQDIRKLISCRVTVDGAAVSFPSLFTWPGTTFSYTAGATADLPQFSFLLSNLTLSTNDLWCGDRVTVRWQGTNQTGAAVRHSWTDALYLSVDNRWDIDDVLIGTVDQTNGLPSNTVYSASADLFVPGVLAGDYHVLVRTVAFNLEGTNGADNTIALPAPVHMPELLIGVPTNGVFLTPGHAKYYQLAVAEGQDLQVSLDLSATDGASELYLRYGAVPTRSDFDVKFSVPFQPDQSVRIPSTRAGVYYLLAYSDRVAAVPALFRVSSAALAFGLAEIKPHSGGNAGEVTMRLSGSSIPPEATAKLIFTKPGGKQVELFPIRKVRTDAEHLFAVFDLSGIEPTVADVALLDGFGGMSLLPKAFQVEVGRPGAPVLEVAGPGAVRNGGAPGTFLVTVRNSGNQDIGFLSLQALVRDDPRLSLRASGGAGMLPEQVSMMGAIIHLMPRLLVGEEMQFSYALDVERDFYEDNVVIAWSADPIPRSRLLRAFSEGFEEDRLAVLAQTDLLTNAPDYYNLALDPVSWQTFNAASLQLRGFDIQPEELVLAQVVPKGWLSSDCQDCLNRAKESCEILKHPEYGAQCRKSYPPESQCGEPAWSYCVRLEYTECLKKYDSCPPPIPGCDQVSAISPSGSSHGTCLPVLHPKDPNAIYGTEGWGTAHYVSPDQVLNYTIAFENLPDASAAALAVEIEDLLPDALDPSSIEIKEIAFGSMTLRPAAGVSHFEQRLLYPAWTWDSSVGWHRGETLLAVAVKAEVDVQTGLFSVKWACSDTNTGVSPSDPYAGFLPPNRSELEYYVPCYWCRPATNVLLVRPGEGYVSFNVKPRKEAKTGTTIANRAGIRFDYNEVISTEAHLNTVDREAPVSQVLPLSSESGRTFGVRWGGQDDTGGCGVAGYDVYVSRDGSREELWFSNTADVAALFVGEPGQTYVFKCIARDWVGNTETLADAPEVFTTVSTNTPVLAILTNRFGSVNSPLVFTTLVNRASADPCLFWLGPGAPTGAAINPTNGVFRWTPTCDQASRSYNLTIWVADAVNTNLMDSTTFTVDVGECVVPSLGNLVLRAGDAGRLPVHLVSSVPLTNFSMTVDVPSSRITDLTLGPIVPEICTAAVTPIDDSLQRLTLQTCSNQFIIGTQQVAWLYFGTVSNQASAFVTFQLDNTVGHQTDGTEIRNFAPQSGRVAVIGEEPLLEAAWDTNRLPLLVLYGRPGSTNAVFGTPHLAPSPSWLLDREVVLTNLYQFVEPAERTNGSRYFRAVR